MEGEEACLSQRQSHSSRHGEREGQGRKEKRLSTSEKGGGEGQGRKGKRLFTSGRRGEEGEKACLSQPLCLRLVQMGEMELNMASKNPLSMAHSR